MDSVLDGAICVNRTKLIGWTAFVVCILGYGAFAAILVLNQMDRLDMREVLLFGGAAAIIGEIGLWIAAGSLGWSLFRKRKAFFDRVFHRGSPSV